MISGMVDPDCRYVASQFHLFMNSNIYGKSADFVPYFLIIANYSA